MTPLNRRVYGSAICSLGFVLTMTVSAAAAVPYFDVNGKLLPFASEDEVLEYLRTAAVVESGDMERGTNKKKLKVVLERNGVRVRAIFRFGYKLIDNPTGGFVDSYKSEIAAYELSRLLDLDRVPAVVLRKWKRKQGAMQIWMEKATTDDIRRKEGVEPPDPEDFESQLRTMRIFDVLIQNSDRNPGNILIDADWRVWYIDQTRSFTGDRRLKYADRLTGSDAELLRRLRSVSEREISDRIGKYTRNLDALEERRQLLIVELGRLAAGGAQ